MALKYTIDHHGYNISVSMETFALQYENWVQVPRLNQQKRMQNLLVTPGSTQHEKQGKIFMDIEAPRHPDWVENGHNVGKSGEINLGIMRGYFLGENWEINLKLQMDNHMEDVWTREEA